LIVGSAPIVSSNLAESVDPLMAAAIKGVSAVSDPGN
jgi:hypothetical protein